MCWDSSFTAGRCGSRQHNWGWQQLSPHAGSICSVWQTRHCQQQPFPQVSVVLDARRVRHFLFVYFLMGKVIL